MREKGDSQASKRKNRRFSQTVSARDATRDRSAIAISGRPAQPSAVRKKQFELALVLLVLHLLLFLLVIVILLLRLIETAETLDWTTSIGASIGWDWSSWPR